jgi:hypothetical protein
MDARIIASPRDLPLPIVQRGERVTLYRNEAAPGRAWLVPQAQAISSVLTALADPAFDLRQTVLLERKAPDNQDHLSNPTAQIRKLDSQVEFLQDSANAVTIRAALDADGWLVVADTFYPGWQATLDGQPVEILRANHAFRAVALPPGEHIVTFHYAPPVFAVGAAISLLSLAGWLAAWVARRLVGHTAPSSMR